MKAKGWYIKEYEDSLDRANARIRELEKWAQWAESFGHHLAKDKIYNLEAKLRELELEHQSLCEDHTALLTEYREQRDRAEAKLRELVEAAEWLDECNALYSGMYQDWLCDDDEVSESQDWMESIFDISEAAETAYQAALNAAREG